MRIVTGEFKGRHFFPPKNLAARPTTDIAKEGLFDILSHRLDFEDISVYDMFGGTGGISIEFASRGCEHITLTELNSVNYAFIRKVIDELKVRTIQTYKTDAFRFVQSCKGKFDLVFADPPYELPKLPEIPDLIFEKGLLNEGGVLILEHPKEFDFSQHPHFSEHRKYGHVNFTFFE
jgi:16S rRNA (guanine966-N2)-methyltransferase